MKTIVNIKTEREIKLTAQKIASDLGLSLSAVINAYLRQFIRNKNVYFSLTPKMSPELEELLGQVEHDIKRGKNISRAFKSPSSLNSYLSKL